MPGLWLLKLPMPNADAIGRRLGRVDRHSRISRPIDSAIDVRSIPQRRLSRPIINSNSTVGHACTARQRDSATSRAESGMNGTRWSKIRRREGPGDTRSRSPVVVNSISRSESLGKMRSTVHRSSTTGVTITESPHARRDGDVAADASPRSGRACDQAMRGVYESLPLQFKKKLQGVFVRTPLISAPLCTRMRVQSELRTVGKTRID